MLFINSMNNRKIPILLLLSAFYIVNISCLLKSLYLRSNFTYLNTINYYCPDELNDNYAGRDGLYYNNSNQDIKISIMKKYFHHCGAWCLFDYRDPRDGWYWNSTIRNWNFQKNLYLICPDNEFHYCLDKFLNERIEL